MDALLLWKRKEGFAEDTLCRFPTMNILRDYDFKMSCLPSYSEAEEKFHETYGRFAVFVIMPFNDTLYPVYQTIEKTLRKHDLVAVRADKNEFSDELWSNVETYLNCCYAAIAVFNKFDNEGDFYNPNVALETGYMMALGRKVCLLKDNRLSRLPSDIISKLYKTYDMNDIENSISQQIESWLKDNF